MTRAHPFFTIRHSTQPIAAFVDLLRDAKIRLIIDVRTVPRSRTNPQSNWDALSESLSEFQIVYEHIAALGGLRGRRRDVPATSITACIVLLDEKTLRAMGEHHPKATGEPG
jgi:uncharacterized protein (DUF488 family)